MDKKELFKPKDQEGNVLFSALMNTISKISDRGSITYEELVTLETLVPGVIKMLELIKSP